MSSPKLGVGLETNLTTDKSAEGLTSVVLLAILLDLSGSKVLLLTVATFKIEAFEILTKVSIFKVALSP